ncbi:MAG TPA: glycosyltransferase [Tepidisphaeraceae bacterium]|jgi:glycosyltransferase involved in cell wall biosynthesis|nr:glycosyltransferase [Tepidisphaeraceae bacterium]
MKVLHFALITPTSPQWGLRRALEKLSGGGQGGRENYQELNWFPLRDNDRPAIREGFIGLVRSFKPDLVFCQIQDEGILPGRLLDEARSTGAWVMQWCGDLRNDTRTWVWEVAGHVDLNCFSNLRDVENLRAKGHPAEFLNIGFSTDTFCPDGPRLEGELRDRVNRRLRKTAIEQAYQNHVRVPDVMPTLAEIPPVIFAGTNYGSVFPRSHERQMMVAHLRQRYGERFAVFGTGWGPDNPFLLEEEEAAAYRSCKIALNHNHFDDVPGFSSDRILRGMGSGAFMISNVWPKMEDEYTDGEHLATWKPHDFDHLCQQIDYYLEHDDERRKIAEAGCRHVHHNHSWDARMKQILSFMESYRDRS